MGRRRCAAIMIALTLAVLTLGAPVSQTTPRAEAAEPAYACSPAAKPANLLFSLKDLDDSEVRLSAFKGKVILLNFWATWCGPCKVEIPWFIDFQERYGGDGLQVLGISIDDPLALLKPYAASYKINYPVLQGLGHREVLAASFGRLTGVPTSFLISRDGNLCAKHIGVTPHGGFEAQVQGLLRPQQP
jgi:thiol-disulfide isomerase/thioredoxin